MIIFLDILKFIVPALLVMVSTYIIINKMFVEQTNQRRFELIKITNNSVLSLKLKAYERVTLFLERTKPESMLVRFDLSSANNGDLQLELLKCIREEYEHNLSQQIYISPELWESVKLAKDSLIQLINISATNVNKENSAMQLAEVILTSYNSSFNRPTDVALAKLKNEVATITT